MLNAVMNIALKTDLVVSFQLRRPCEAVVSGRVYPHRPVIQLDSS